MNMKPKCFHRSSFPTLHAFKGRVEETSLGCLLNQRVPGRVMQEERGAAQLTDQALSAFLRVRQKGVSFAYARKRSAW
jgi:hypothetical protein